MKIVIFFTKDSIYSTHAELCCKAASRFFDDIHVERIEPNDWLEVVNFKADFLLRMRRNFRGPILYVDADSFMHMDVFEYFSDIKEDMAVYYLNNGSQDELISATIYLNDTPGAVAVLEEWYARTEVCRNRFDQIVLQEVIDDFLADGRVKIHRLPPEYCFIFDTSREMFPGVTPVIEQLQASREIRFQKKQDSFLRRIFGMEKKVSRRLKYRRAYMQQLAATVDCEIIFDDRNRAQPMCIKM